MSFRHYPCLLCGQEVEKVYLKKLKSYRPILPKIVLETNTEDPVDPTLAPLVSGSELREIEHNVQEAVRKARKRHEAGDQNMPLDLSSSLTLYPKL